MEYFNRDQAWPSNGVFSNLPVQAIPTRQKTKEWFHATMDALEHIGMKQMDANQKYRDFYRMKDGKLSYMELRDVIPFLKDVQTMRSGVDIPSFLKHYDLIGTITNAFVGWLSNMSDKYNVVGLDETEVNQYTYTKEALLHQYIREVMDQRIRQAMLERGIDPDYNNFETEEERQAYQQQVEQMRATMTPPEIEKFMNTKWKSAAVLWASDTLEADRQRFYMDEIDQENFIDYILTGKCFRNMLVGYDYYKPERWSPLNTFYSETLDSKYPQYGEYIGRVHYFTASQIISRYGHMLTAKQKQKLIGGFSEFTGSYNPNHSGGYTSLTKAASVGMMYENRVIPWKGYYDYASILGFEDYSGLPQGVYTYYDEEGTPHSQPRFLPRFGQRNFYNRANRLTDEHLRNDMYQVTEAYWVSPQQVYIIKFQSESGLVSQEIVTDELLQDFLRENGIKRITRTMKQAKEDQDVNTYFVDYVPQVRYGVKISGGYLAEENLYLDGEPISHQIKGDSNLYDFVLPVAGYVGESLAAKIQPYQIFYNYNMNQINSILEKEIGKFFLADINFIPSEYKNLGEDIGDVWANLMDAAKAVGALPVDTSAQNTKGGVPFNQFSVYDLSQTDQLKIRMELAEFAKNKCYEMVGITPQAIQGPNKYETATGVRQGANATFTQTQIWYDNFECFKRRALDIHLAVAQQCQEEGKDISVMYTKSDLTRAFLTIGTDGLAMRHLGVQTITNAKKRQEMERMKEFMLQMNTAGSDMYDLAAIISSDSMVELQQAALQSRLRQDQVRQQEQQNQMQLQQQQIEAAQQEKEREYQHEMQVEDLKGRYRLQQEYIQATGRAADAKADDASLQFLRQEGDMTMRQAELDSREQLETRRMDDARAANEMKTRIELEKLNLQAKQLAQRAREDATKRYVAGINKN